MKRLKSFLLNHWQKQFLLSRSIIVIMSAMLGNVFAYLFQVISGRYFDVEDYATLVSLFAVSGIVMLIISFLANGIVKTVSEIKDINYPDKISSLFFTIFKINMGIAIVTTILFILFRNPLSDYLNINNTKIIIIFGFATGAAAVASQFLPFLQGLQRFKAFSFLSVTSAFFKFSVALVVMLLGLSLSSTFWGLGITTIFIAIIGYLLLRKNIKNNVKFNKEDLSLVVKYALGGFIALVGINLIQNIDVVLVKHFFHETEAGIYSSVVIIGRIVFFVSAPVGMVLLPIVSEKFKKEKNTMKILSIATGLTISLAGFVSILYWTIPNFIVNILFGQKYIGAVNYLPIFSIFMLLFSLLALFSYYFIAVSKFKWASLTMLAAILQYIGISLYHENLYNVIYASTIAVGISLFIAIIPMIKMIKD